jgi:sugar/nucleoside kinase (ribokinase family)
VIEAYVMGRVGVDLYPNQLRTPLKDVRTYTRFVGGFAGNVSTGLARLGVQPAILSRVGAEGHGEFVRAFLASEGIDVQFLRTDPDWPAPPTIGNKEEVDAAMLEDVPVLVLKRGEHGATVHQHGEVTEVPGFPVEVVNGLGAGDAFAAAVGHGLLRGLALVEAVRRGTVAGALVAAQLACSEAMPRLEELEAAPA